MINRNKGRNIDLKLLTQWLEKIDPFDIPLEEFKALRKGKYRTLADRIIMKQLYKNYGSWIETQFKERQGIQALVVCDRQVILSTEDEYGPSGKQIDEIELKMGKPCYLISREPLIEENASWTNPRQGDYYPTLEVYLGNMKWSDHLVFRNGVKILCDFDTGNPRYSVFNEEICQTIAGDPEKVDFRRHLGYEYVCYLRQMKIGVTDGQQGRCLQKTVEGISDWEDVNLNPYKFANPYRMGFIGRDIMLKLLVRITLNPKLQKSSWKLLKQETF